MHSKIDHGEPRQVVYQTFAGSPGPCPQCGERLQKRHKTYSVSTYRGQRAKDSFIVCADFGWYCNACPVVVIDSGQLSQMFSNSLPHWEVGNEIRIDGLVDLDAIPQNKRHLTLDEIDFPLPLTEFIDASEKSPQKRLTKKERQQRKKQLTQR